LTTCSQSVGSLAWSGERLVPCTRAGACAQ